jgi:hypothetical protein
VESTQRVAEVCVRDAANRGSTFELQAKSEEDGLEVLLVKGGRSGSSKLV